MLGRSLSALRLGGSEAGKEKKVRDSVLSGSGKGQEREAPGVPREVQEALDREIGNMCARFHDDPSFWRMLGARVQTEKEKMRGMVMCDSFENASSCYTCKVGGPSRASKRHPRSHSHARCASPCNAETVLAPLAPPAAPLPLVREVLLPVRLPLVQRQPPYPRVGDVVA